MKPVSASTFIPAAVDHPQIGDFDALVRLHWPRVFRFALAALRDRDAAETVAQDCFVRAHRARSTFRGDSSVQTWLMRIAVNLVRDAARNRRLQFWKHLRDTSLAPDAVSDWLPDPEASPESKALLKEHIQIAWTAAAALSAKQRIVFLLRFVEDMDLLEIAAATGMSEGAVKVHLFRAVHSVRKKIGNRL
jgi:RNA polymerase sigma-70 factor (ECF subfamily)